MRKLLMTVSSLTVLTIANNSFATIFNQNTSVNNNLKSTVNEVQTSLFNNKYNYLSTSDWITNQSTTDHKFYSYDTSKAKNISEDAQNAFLVNDQGELIYNPDFKIPPADKFKFDNTKQQMISNKKVTLIKDNNNPSYSKSLYSSSYFSGDNQDWQFLQQGGIEKHIDISSQSSAIKVANNNSLSETMGLYYIAQAIKVQHGIDEGVADDLGKYFIEQSSLKSSIGTDLTNKIIHIIANNNDIYKLLQNAPMRDGTSNLYKNYAVNYIFDSSNNLIEVYYSKWNTDNITINLNYKLYKSYNGSGHDNGSYEYKVKVMNWRKYSNNWSDFCTVYSRINFDNSSILKVNADDEKSDSKCGSSLDFDINSEQGHYPGVIAQYISGWGAEADISAQLVVTYDDSNFYFLINLNVSTETCGDGSFLTVEINKLTLNNIMS